MNVSNVGATNIFQIQQPRADQQSHFQKHLDSDRDVDGDHGIDTDRDASKATMNRIDHKGQHIDVYA